MMRKPTVLISIWLPFLNSSSALVSSVKNFRAVSEEGALYRSATLDDLSVEEAQGLLDGSLLGTPLTAVLDLRNPDEIKPSKRSEGANLFYSQLEDPSEPCKLVQIPILQNVDAFWDEAIDRLDPVTKITATFQSAFQGGALDRAAARNLEQQGLSMLYSVMLATSQSKLRQALEVCAITEEGAVLFHCQKGKDRTGVLAMLIQACRGDDVERIIEEYGISGEMLGGDEAKQQNANPVSTSSSGMIDWSYFKGSPEVAMKDTVDWILKNYGSIDAYLDSIQFDSSKRELFLKKTSFPLTSII